MQLEGKTAIVTGAASGIGAEIARVFAAAGARVCIADIDAEAAAKTASDIANSIALRMDVSDEGEVERGVEQAARALGGIDILVSNAGVQHLDTIADVSFADWKRVLAIHLDGGFLTTRACLRRMIARGRGGAAVRGRNAIADTDRGTRPGAASPAPRGPRRPLRPTWSSRTRPGW